MLGETILTAAAKAVVTEAVKRAAQQGHTWWKRDSDSPDQLAFAQALETAKSLARIAEGRRMTYF
jgi:hypothetical protein